MRCKGEGPRFLRRRIGLAASGALLLVPLFARAQPASASCPARAAKEAQARYEALDFAGVISATAGLETCEDGSAAELAEGLRWRAQALMAQGNSTAATETFVLLATVAPGYALDPMLSPRLHELFRTGKTRAKEEQRIFARLLAPSRRTGSAMVRVEVHDAVARDLQISFVFKSGSSSREVEAQRVEGERYEAAVPAAASGPYRAQVTHGGEVVFLTPNGRVAAADTPVATRPRIELEPDQEPDSQPEFGGAVKEDGQQPNHLRTGLLVLGGVAAVAAIVVGSLALSNRQPDPYLGRIDLP